MSKRRNRIIGMTLVMFAMAMPYLSCNPQSPINSSGNSSSQSNSSAPPASTAGDGSSIPQPNPQTYGAPADMRPWPAFEPARGAGLVLPAGEQAEDYNIINSQAEESQRRYLVGEAIELELPRPNQLISLGGKLPPIRLEANYTQPVALKDALRYAIDNNLDIRIQAAATDSYKWLSVAQFGSFLPNIIMNYQEQLLAGSSLIGGIIPETFHTPNTNVQAGFQFYGFRGGLVMFGALQALHTFRASRAQLKGTLNDMLLNVAKGYYNLVNQQAQLQIQTRAVEVSRAQVTLNQQLERAGTGTRFQVLQSDTQLARDEQSLLQQEVVLRAASIDLATLLNLNATTNLLSVEPEVRKVRLLDPSLDINRLVALAVLHRPELKQYEELRIAARRNIQLQASPLYPQFQFFGSANGTGATLGKHNEVIPGTVETIGTTTPVSSSAANLASLGLSGGSNAGSLGALTGASIAAGSPLSQTASVFTPPTVESRQIRSNWILGIRVDWNYPSFGVPTLANIQAARALARQSLLNSNQQLLAVVQQVRESYLNSQTAERQIEVTTKAVISAAEELRLSRVRLANGVGTNIDVINAQRDFTTALVNKANAIIAFNLAQVQLLHDTGLISYDNLTSGRFVKE